MSADRISCAEEKIAAFEYDAAESLFREYLTEMPEDDAVWAKLGLLLRKTGDLTGSVDAFGTAFDLKPENPGYAENLGEALISLHSFEEADSLFKKAEENDNRVYPKIRQCDILFFRGKTAEAEAKAESLLRQYPDDPEIRHRLFLIYEDEGKSLKADDALKQECVLRKSLAEKTSGALEWLLYGRACLQKKAYADAVSAAEKSLSLEKGPDACLLLGEAHGKAGEISAAKKAFSDAVSCEPKNLSLLLETADIMTELSFYDEAVSLYTRALELRNIRADTWSSLAYALLKLGKKEEAKAFFEMAKASAAVRELKWPDKLHKSEKTRALDEAFKT